MATGETGPMKVGTPQQPVRVAMIGAAGWRTASTTRRWLVRRCRAGGGLCISTRQRRDERVRLTASMHDTPTTER